MKKCYAIKKGFDFETGEEVKGFIVYNWSECAKLVQGVKGAQYKSFTNKEDAIRYLEDKQVTMCDDNTLQVYVDGSYRAEDKKYSYGIVAVRNNVIEFIEYDMFNDISGIRQVAGELKGALRGVSYAKSINEHRVVIFHDYAGVANHIDGTWKTTNETSVFYNKFMKNLMEGISVDFIKVDGHTGNLYNELVDDVCKYPLGIKSTNVMKKWLKDNKICVKNEELRNLVHEITNGDINNLVIE